MYKNKSMAYVGFEGEGSSRSQLMFSDQDAKIQFENLQRCYEHIDFVLDKDVESFRINECETLVNG